MAEPELLVLYRVAEDGTPVPLISSADPELVAQVAKLFGLRLGLTPPPRVLDLNRTRATGSEP